jgi:hypothetical protein
MGWEVTGVLAVTGFYLLDKPFFVENPLKPKGHPDRYLGPLSPSEKNQTVRNIRWSYTQLSPEEREGIPRVINVFGTESEQVDLIE